MPCSNAMPLARSARSANPRPDSAAARSSRTGSWRAITSPASAPPDAPPQAQAAQPVASGVDLANVNFRYAIEGDRAPWRPLRAFDDGRQVFIEFPRGIGQGEMPPLFVVGPEGNTSELVNYRVRGHHMIVDRLFAAAELRFGSGREQKRVRIVRTDGRPTS